MKLRLEPDLDYQLLDPADQHFAEVELDVQTKSGVGRQVMPIQDSEEGRVAPGSCDKSRR